MKNTLYLRYMVLAVVVLFIGVALAPIIQAEPQLEEEQEYFEVQTEFCGLNRQPHTTRLTQSVAEELEQLIQVIEKRLSQVETREETVEIFNEAIEEFHRYGLLGDVSVKRAKRLIIGSDRRQQLLTDIYEKFANIPKNDNANYLCFIAGHLSPSNSINFVLRYTYLLLFSLRKSAIDMDNWKLKDFIDVLLYSPPILIFSFIDFFLLSLISPISFMRTIGAGVLVFSAVTPEYWYVPSEGRVISFGLSGLVMWDDTIWGNASNNRFDGLLSEHYPAIIGFTGAKLTTPNMRSFYLGFALKASMSDVRPY